MSFRRSHAVTSGAQDHGPYKEYYVHSWKSYLGHDLKILLWIPTLVLSLPRQKWTEQSAAAFGAKGDEFVEHFSSNSLLQCLLRGNNNSYAIFDVAVSVEMSINSLIFSRRICWSLSKSDSKSINFLWRTCSYWHYFRVIQNYYTILLFSVLLIVFLGRMEK
jgi:hypothetical protein